jgi:hypothetical protein
MIPLFRDFDTRDLLAIMVVSAFIALTYLLPDAAAAGGMRDMAFIVLGFYFGNKSALDSPASPPASEMAGLVQIPCPYIQPASPTDQAAKEAKIETLGEVI